MSSPVPSADEANREAPRLAEWQRILLFMTVIWGAFLVDWIIPLDFSEWGLRPRTLIGLVGIPLSPFIHASWGHLIGNSVPLVVLLSLLAASRSRTWESVGEIIVLGGGLLWVFGRTAKHVGASGLVYGLIAFLLVAGWRERRPLSLIAALIVGVLYGGTLLSGVLPTAGESISWDGHLLSAIGGAIIAVIQVPKPQADA